MVSLQLPVIGQVQHRRYLPGTLDPAATVPATWGPVQPVDLHGRWQPKPETIGTSSDQRQVDRTLIVPEGTVCGDRDRWIIPGDGEWLQVGGGQDYSQGPFGFRVPLLVHRSRTPEATMVDRCEIRERDSWVTETRQPGPIAHTYHGSDLIPCRVEVDARQPRTLQIGGQTVTAATLTVALPLDICPDVDQVVTIMSARIDQHLVGHRFDVKVADVETYPLERRVLIVEHL